MKGPRLLVRWKVKLWEYVHRERLRIEAGVTFSRGGPVQDEGYIYAPYIPVSHPELCEVVDRVFRERGEADWNRLKS